MISSRPNEENMFSSHIGELRPAVGPVPPRPSSSQSGQEAMATPSDTTRHESPYPPADPERISITTLGPHVLDLPPSLPLDLEDRLIRALFNARAENLYGPVGTKEFQPSIYNVLSSQSVFSQSIFNAILHKSLAIAKFREDHERAIAFDEEDDEEYFPNPLPSQQLSTPSLSRATSPAAITSDDKDHEEYFPNPFTPQQFSTPVVLDATSPAFQPIDMGVVNYPTVQALDPNPSAPKQLDPTAPVFEYQPSGCYIQDMATEADKKAPQAQEPIPELPAPEFSAEAVSAPAPQPHLTPQGTIKLRSLPFYEPEQKKKWAMKAQQKMAALQAQSRHLYHGGGVANRNRAARSQKPQNGKPSSTNGSSGPPRTRGNTSSPARSGPYTPPRTGSNSTTTPATTGTKLPTCPTPSLSPCPKAKDAAGSSNSVRRTATPGPSRGPRTPTATKGAVKTHAGGATPQLSPPAPTTGTAGVPAASTRKSSGRAEAKTWRGSPQADICWRKLESCASVAKTGADTDRRQQRDCGCRAFGRKKKCTDRASKNRRPRVGGANSATDAAADSDEHQAGSCRCGALGRGKRCAGYGRRKEFGS
ncbi:hypothetical protein VE03_02031 [Pseudogymnoascus sp. 23342-1-I1]|nr:hypothetical protein VE03_02031 [Pseudogymnoascus sp. 23342-1-I1]